MLNAEGLHMIAIPQNGSVSCDSSLTRLCLAFCRITALYLASMRGCFCTISVL